MIRPFNRFDFEPMIALGGMMHREAPTYRGLPYDPAKLRDLGEAMLANPDTYQAWVSYSGDQLDGMMVGAIAAHYFGSGKYATDLLLYVRPDRRGGMLAARLVKTFEGWAKDMGADWIMVGTSTGINPTLANGLYARLGYEPVGYIMRKDV